MDKEKEKEKEKEKQWHDDATISDWHPKSQEEEEKDSGHPPLHEWTDVSAHQPVYTIFFQGAAASQTHLAKYTGNWGFVATTGESFVHPNGMEAILQPFVGVETPEIILRPKYGPGSNAYPHYHQSPSFCRHPMLWTGRLFSDMTQEFLGCRAIPSGCCSPAVVVMVPTTGTGAGIGYQSNLTVQNHTLRMDRINIGQQGDVAAHQRKWKALVQQWRSKGVIDTLSSSPAAAVETTTTTTTTISTGEKSTTPSGHKEPGSDRTGGDMGDNDNNEDDLINAGESCIFFGVSRGAAATLNALAHNRYDNARIKLVVLEACFDTVQSVLKKWVGGCFAPILEFGLGMTTAYEPGGLSPLKSVQSVPTNVPLAFVTSLKDRLVPQSCTLRIVKAIRAAGHENVHLLILQHSKHGGYAEEDPIDRKAYTLWLHALYKRYRVPYISDYALEGECLLDEEPNGGQQTWFKENDDGDAIKNKNKQKKKSGKS